MFEVILVIIMGVVLITHPVFKGTRPGANDPHNVAVVGAVAVTIFIIYSIYVFIKSKKQK